jgi:hypothetical protein
MGWGMLSEFILSDDFEKGDRRPHGPSNDNNGCNGCTLFILIAIVSIVIGTLTKSC